MLISIFIYIYIYIAFMQVVIYFMCMAYLLFKLNIVLRITFAPLNSSSVNYMFRLGDYLLN